MKNEVTRLSRRAVMAGSAAALGAALVPGRDAVAVPVVAKSAVLMSQEFVLGDGDVRLAVYRRRMGDKVSRPVLFLAHGSSISAMPTFDLKVPNGLEYSMLDVFARHGFDVWTMDFEGYGKSSHTGGNSNIDRSVQNIELAWAKIAAETGQAKMSLYGESSGALRVGAYAQTHPERVERLGLGSLSYTGEGSPTLAERKKGMAFLTTHDRRPRDRKMIASIFTRDGDATYDKAVPEALADAELKVTPDESVPTGSYVDMVTRLPILDPKKMTMPVLILRGELDGIATDADVMAFFKDVACPEREFRLIAGTTHAIGWSRSREVAWASLLNFLQPTALVRS